MVHDQTLSENKNKQKYVEDLFQKQKIRQEKLKQLFHASA